MNITSSLRQTLHSIHILDDDDDDNEDADAGGATVSSLSRAISENMFTNASSSAFMTHLTHNVHQVNQSFKLTNIKATRPITSQ